VPGVYTHSFQAIIDSGHVKTLVLPARSPNLWEQVLEIAGIAHAYTERWIRSAKDECLSKLILFGERSLRRALSEYVQHYHVPSETIKAEATSCCFRGLPWGIARGACNVARGWAGSCAIRRPCS
jgi:hypothetical protein